MQGEIEAKLDNIMLNCTSLWLSLLAAKAYLLADKEKHVENTKITIMYAADKGTLLKNSL